MSVFLIVYKVPLQKDHPFPVNKETEPRQITLSSEHLICIQKAWNVNPRVWLLDHGVLDY